MGTTAGPARDEGLNRARGRFAFFSWFFALLGVGAVILSLLLVGGGIVAWSSAVGLVLLGLSLLGVIALSAALASLFRSRHNGATGKAGR